MKPDAPKPVVIQNGPEPAAERRSVPMWQLVVLAGIVYWGCLFMADDAGGFAREVYRPFRSTDELAAANPVDPETAKRNHGRLVFEKNCAACHQSSGSGKEGTAPPLDGSEWVQAKGANRVVHIVMNGLAGPIKVKGQDWNLSGMPSWRPTLKDDEIADVLTYVRSSWSNKGSPAEKAGPVDVALVKAARAESHPVQMAADELQKLQE